MQKFSSGIERVSFHVYKLLGDNLIVLVSHSLASKDVAELALQKYTLNDV